jgi:glycosyltransferase involved in cell wall biosynthesis
LAKRILIYTNHFYPEQFKINEIVEWISNEGSHVRIITGLPNYPSGKIMKEYHDIHKDNITVNRLFLIPRGSGSNLMLITNYISYFISCFFFTIYIALFKKKYDVVFVHHTSPIFIAFHPVIYSFFKKTKKILWDLDIWPESLQAVGVVKSGYIISILEIMVKWVYSKYDSILVSSKSLCSIVKKRFDGRIIYFPNWADKVIEDNKKDDKHSFSINPKKFNIIYTGNIGKSQNFKSLLKTIEHVDDNIHWTFVGDGRFKSQLIKLIEIKNLSAKVSFIDQVSVDSIPSIISKADSLFLSLKSDFIFSKTVPAKLQTYMALGKPIIGVLKGEGAKLIVDSNCGIVEENYNYNELAKKINIFASKNSSELIKKGENAKKYYFKHFSSLIRKKEILNLIYE